MLNFVWLHPDCHRYCHDHPAYARKNGLLEYTFDIEKRIHNQHQLLLNGDAAFDD